MTLSEVESSWNQLKGDVRLTKQTRDRARESDSAPESFVLKPSRHVGTFIRRRNPAQGEQAGWTAGR